MTQQLPPNGPPEPDEPDIQPEPEMPRFIVYLGLIALAVGFYGVFISDIGEPVTLPDGTLQATTIGKILGGMFIVGFLVVLFSSSPWGLLQFLFIISGALLGGHLFSQLEPENSGAGRIGGLIGLGLGAGVGFATTWVLSWLLDMLKRLRARHHGAGLQRRIDRQDESQGPSGE